MVVEADNDSSKGSSGSAKSICTLSIPDIIGALHEKALEQCKAESSGVTLTNSAFSKDGKLETAGDHMICATPNLDSDVDKAGAVKILQSYVQWFAGPDLAKKVTDGSVKEILADDNGSEEPSSEEADSLKESKHVPSFKTWLLCEAGEPPEDDSPSFEDDSPSFGDDSEEEPEENTSRADDTDFSDSSDDSGDDPTDKGKDKDKKDTNDEEKKPAGYYVGYSLKVEGMKESTADDAMKSTSALWKYAKTFFDGMKITFTKLGSGGSGESFTIKDIKNAFGETFGKIDPNKLVSNVEKELRKRYPNTPANAEIRDQKTLLSEIGDQLTGEDKAKIAKSKYSLRIDVTESDPKKNILTTAEVADIVTSSISGLWKKFKNGISRNDVIYIKDYADVHRNPEELKKLQNLVPDHVEISNLIRKTSNSGDVYENLKKKMDKIADHKQGANSKLVNACLKVWEELKSQFNKDKERLQSLTGKAKDEFFKPFADKYKKTYEKYYDNSLNESICVFSQPTYIVSLKKLVLENFTNAINEKSEAEVESTEFSSQQIDNIKSFAKTYLKKNVEEPNLIDIDRKDILKDKCKVLDVPSDFDTKFGDFKQGILVDFTGVVRDQSKKTLDESFKSSIKYEIMDILGEADDEDSSKEVKQIDPNVVYTALTMSLTKNGVEEGDYADSLIEIGQVKISGDGKLDESALLEANAVDRLIDKNGWTKKQALKPENLKLLMRDEAWKKSKEKTIAAVEKHFSSKSSKKDPSEGKKDSNDGSSKPDSPHVEKKAYILPFGKEEHIAAPKAEISDVNLDSDVEGTGRTDVYIVPMPKLGYSDSDDN